MRFMFVLILIFLNISEGAKGSQISSLAKPLRYLYVNTSQITSSPEEKQFLEELFFTAVSLLTLHPVSPVAIQQGTRERFDFFIEFTDAATARATFPEATKHLLSSHFLDAYTFIPDSNQKIPIVRVLLDKVVYEESAGGELYERSDAVVRLITVLAHEIYGNVYGFMGPTRSRKDSELFAFRTSIRFLESLIADWKKRPDPTIQKMVVDLESSLQREHVLLKSWETSLEEDRVDDVHVIAKAKAETYFVSSFEQKRCSNYFSQ